MVINRVPKFVEKQIAKRRREGPSSGSDKRRFTAFDAARKKYEEKQQRIEEVEQRKAEKDKQQVEKQKERKKIGKLVNKRNERGQPNMHAQLEVLLKRFPTSSHK